MIYLILAMLCGASLAICFKVFKKIGIDSLQGIFFNYLTAIAVSIALSGNGFAGLGQTFRAAFAAPWLWLAIIEGLLFMGGILVLAASTQRSGIAVTNVSARASMVIPVVASYLVFHEGNPKWAVIALVLVAMFMIFGNLGKKEKVQTSNWMLPVSVFLVYGICDFLLKVLKAQLTDGTEGNITLFIFGTAAVFCIVTYLVRGHFKDHPFSWKAIPGGIILGLFNSFCTVLMLKALGVMDAVVFYPVYNVGVVCLSLLAGVLVFKEKINWIQAAGIVLALISIVLFIVL